jgi:3-oxoadipate enol-lactonase
MMHTLVFAFALLFQVHSPDQTVPAAAGNGQYANVGDTRIWYEECRPASATATAVVLLHDGLAHSVTWDDVWTPLCAQYHVVRYDRRGYGRSEPAKAPFVPEDDLAAIMRRVHMERAIIAGNSSGGALALDFALAHPEMVEGLFLIGPVVHGMASSEYFNQRGERNSAPLEHGDAKAAAENWSRDRFLIAGDNPRARKELYDTLTQNPQNLRVGGGMEIRPSPPSVLRLPQIKAPALVLVGEADIGDVFACSGAIDAALPLASLEIWKDAGHLIQIEKPAELVSRFNSFVAVATRKEAEVPEGTLRQYVGEYRIFNRTAKLFLQDRRLVLEFPGDPYRWLFAASETRFFLRTGKAEIEFEKDAGGKIVGMAIHNSDGSVIRGPRL